MIVRELITSYRTTRSSPFNAAACAAEGRGGIGDLLRQVLGGAGGGTGGSLGGLLEPLQRTGFGEQADSWVGRGANKAISPDATSQIFGKVVSR